MAVLFALLGQGLHWMHKPSAHHLFPKLRLQFKPNLVQLKGGMSELPITDKSARATPLKPTEWKEMLMSAREVRGLWMIYGMDFGQFLFYCFLNKPILLFLNQAVTHFCNFLAHISSFSMNL